MDRFPRLPNGFQLGLLAQVVAGTVMAGIGIGTAPFWADEIVSVSMAERSFGDIIRVFPNIDANMGLYYFLLHAWMWGGDSEAWVRALSALAAVVAIPITAILARRLFGEAVGVVAGFLMVGSMFVVVHAQNARGYTLALLLITVATLLFVEAVRSRRPTHFIAYGAASALALYASPLSGLVLVAHLASLPFLPRARDLVRPCALTYGAVLIAVAPLAAAMLATGSNQLSWVERPGFTDVRIVAEDMLGGGNRSLSCTYAALIVIGLVALGRGEGTGEQQAEPWRWRCSVVIGWLLLPPVLLFVASQIQPLFLDRFLLTSAPAIAITAAIGLVALARRLRALAVAAAVIVSGLAIVGRAGLEHYGEARNARSDRAAARMIATQSEAGDGIAYAPAFVRLSFEWNLRDEAAPGADLPADFAVAAEAEEVGHLYAQEVSPEILVRRLRHYPRVWLVEVAFSFEWHPTPEPMLDAGVSVLRSEYRRVRSRDFGFLSVELHERKRGR